MEYSFNCLKELFGNYGYDFQYEIIPKRNECWATRTHLDYLNIIVDIRDKYGNHIFFTDENVFTLKTGEKMICEKVMNKKSMKNHVENVCRSNPNSVAILRPVAVKRKRMC